MPDTPPARPVPHDTVYLLYSVAADGTSATPHAVYLDPASAAFDCAQEQAADASRIFGVRPLPLFEEDLHDA